MVDASEGLIGEVLDASLHGALGEVALHLYELLRGESFALDMHGALGGEAFGTYAVGVRLCPPKSWCIDLGIDDESAYGLGVLVASADEG